MPRRNEACQERDRLAAAGDSASKTPADSRLRAEWPAFQFVPVIGLSGGFSTVRGSSRTPPFAHGIGNIRVPRGRRGRRRQDWSPAPRLCRCSVKGKLSDIGPRACPTKDQKIIEQCRGI